MAVAQVTVTEGPDLHQRIADAAERHGVKTSEVLVVKSGQIDTSSEGAPNGALLADKRLER